ncbi:MAG: ATP-dependent 6-phosphofructokinase [bacterium]|nr:ATP-dependent 6-phosphofructokinase [bacterium]
MRRFHTVSNSPSSNADRFSVEHVGPRGVTSPYRTTRYVSDDERILYDTSVAAQGAPEGGSPCSFELAGPRERIYFDPSKTRCGVVTCGGLCPGLNDVIRAIVLQLYHWYGVHTVYGFRYGFEGLIPHYGHEALMLTPKTVSNIHQEGGSILASSRGPQPFDEMVDALERLNVQVLFCIGGDGTFQGALDLSKEIRRRNLKISVIAVPKTIDNDVAFTTRTFGFETAYSIATEAIRGAHVEATGAPNGIGLVKLMGRHAGFIAAHAVLASRDANFCLVPEVEFELAGGNGFLTHVLRRIQSRGHAVIVTAEGAGQQFFEEEGATDASGNKRLKDIGVLLRERITQYFRLMKVPLSLKYIDPSYLIRSAPAHASDSLFAGLLGQMAAHAAMAGKTEMFIGYWNDQFTHVPIAAATTNTKRLDPHGNLWQSVIECTGQPRSMTNRVEEEDADPGEPDLVVEPCGVA